jgi:hypothetical protein
MFSYGGAVPNRGNKYTGTTARCNKFCDILHKMHLDFVRAVEPVYINTLFGTAPLWDNFYIS